MHTSRKKGKKTKYDDTMVYKKTFNNDSNTFKTQRQTMRSTTYRTFQ